MGPAEIEPATKYSSCIIKAVAVFHRNTKYYINEEYDINGSSYASYWGDLYEGASYDRDPSFGLPSYLFLALM
jgi:hypothetical protein